MFAPTAVCPLRKRLLIGEVDDENAFAMGGVAGHAGLFAPVREVDRIVAELLACYAGRSDFVPQKIVQHSWSGGQPHDGGVFVAKRNHRKLRGYVIMPGGLTHVGNLSHTDHAFRYYTN